MPCNPSDHFVLHRRDLLVAGGLGFYGLLVPELLGGAIQKPAGAARTAKSTILIWLSGGPSHIDLWDMKPNAPQEIRGEFQPIQTSAPEITLCEHLPLLANQAHHLAVVRSVGQPDSMNDHHAGYYYNLTGHRPEPGFNSDRHPLPDDWPYIGSVVASQQRLHPYLPQQVMIPGMAGAPESRRPGQFAARLGVQHDPLYVMAKPESPRDFQIPSLALPSDMTSARLQDRKEVLGALGRAQRQFDRSRSVGNFSELQAKAINLITSEKSKAAFDISREPEAIREKYGTTLNAMSMLMARRLVEAKVPFVTIFATYEPKAYEKNGCKGGGWDTHWNNFGCLKDYLVPEFDRAFAALLDDLHQRGLLDDTLLVVTSEMGRKPKIGDRRGGSGADTGRDHWTPCMSVLLAGGGIRGGQTYGATDKIGAYPDDKPVTPSHIAKTIYHAMGVHRLEAIDEEGKSFNLMEEGRALTELF